MQKTSAYSLVTITAIILIAVIVTLFFQQPQNPSMKEDVYAPTPFVFREHSFVARDASVQTEAFIAYSDVKEAFYQVDAPTYCKAYRAGIVNHHALAADMLAQSARTLKACRPDIETIIVISPDHFYRGVASLTTADVHYHFGDQTIATNASLLDTLIQDIPTIGIQSNVFEKEHGIAALIPFYAHEFASLQIVPIAVKGRIDKETSLLFISWIKNMLEEPKTFVLISADMSHYLSKEQALLHDQKTLQALKTNDIEFFATASDDYIDSGVQVSLVLRALKDPMWYFMQQKISTDYTNDRTNTTSYITGFWE